MIVGTCLRMTKRLTNGLAQLILALLLASGCRSGSITLRPPDLDELRAFSRDQGITPISDTLLDDSVVLLYQRSGSFGCYTLGVRESTGALEQLGHISAAKSDEPVLIIAQLGGDRQFIAAVIQDHELLAETAAIEISIDPQNRLTATIAGEEGAVLISPSPVNGWLSVTLYDAQGSVLYGHDSG